MPDIRIDSLDGSSFDAYASLPPGGNGPGLIVIHGVFGLTKAVKALCDSLAAKGFLVVCPNLFWRHGGGAADNDTIHWESAAENYKKFDVEASLRDLLATLAHVRRSPGCGGKVGALGFCLGGRLAFLLAARSDVDCAVGYDGVGIDSYLDEVHDIRVPFLLHLAEQDRLMPSAVREKIQKALSRNKAIVCWKYPGAEHGFARKDGASYHPGASGLAEERTLAFLIEHLMV